MAGTILKYMEEYGDYTFEEKPLNEVDALILCQLSYLKFDGIVPSVHVNRRSVTLRQVASHADYEKLFADERFAKQNRALFEHMVNSKRYASMRLNCYINIIEEEWETQFSAITFILPDKTIFLAYRGTDETLIGWKEDFNMCFLDPVPGQSYSSKYMNIVTGRFPNDFYVGGHSKGGNLAVYAAMTCKEPVRNRILAVYNLDGPGFRPEVLQRCNYVEIRDKVIKILPHSSLVGMLFETDDHYRVVESNRFGLLQHDPYTWLAEEDTFLYVDNVYAGRKFMDETINEWILSMNETERKLFVDTLYQVISASETDNLIDFVANWKKSITGAMNAVKGIDSETGKMMKKIIRSLLNMVGDNMKKEWLKTTQR